MKTVNGETRTYRWDEKRLTLSGVVYADRQVIRLDDADETFDRGDFERALRKVSGRKASSPAAGRSGT